MKRAGEGAGKGEKLPWPEEGELKERGEDSCSWAMFPLCIHRLRAVD